MKKFNKRGFVLPSVLFIFIILMLLGITLLAVSNAEAKHSIRQQHRSQAYYIARSGIETGLDLLRNTAQTGDYRSLNDLVNDVESSYGNNKSYTLGTDGNFTLKYYPLGIHQIKIESIGNNLIDSSIQEKVTLTVGTTFAQGFENNPKEWIAGINLIKGITSGTNYIGNGVRLLGNPTQSPMGSGTDSEFAASIIHFEDYSGISLRQVTNTINISFNAEILYFESDIILNKTGEAIYFKLTDIVANDNELSGENDGFNNYDRYLDFINGSVDNINWFDRHAEYIDVDGNSLFEINKKYGIVGLQGTINDDDGNLLFGPGYYYYPDGINIYGDLTNNEYDRFIPLISDDAAIEALESMFLYRVSSSGYMWDDK